MGKGIVFVGETLGLIILVFRFGGIQVFAYLHVGMVKPHEPLPCIKEFFLILIQPLKTTSQ
jgi:hypothetical protein